jgi:hypothetical protein
MTQLGTPAKFVAVEGTSASFRRRAFVLWVCEQGIAQFSNGELLRFIEQDVAFPAFWSIRVSCEGGFAGVDLRRILKKHQLAMGIFRAITVLPGLSERQRKIIGKGICSIGVLLGDAMEWLGVYDRLGFISRQWCNFRVGQTRRRGLVVQFGEEQ